MTNRRLRIWIASAVLLACAPSLAGATEDAAAATTLSKPTTNIRTVANIDVAAPRVAKAPASLVHRRKVAWQKPRPASIGVMQVAYRPMSETMCSSSLCGLPVMLILGIGY